MLPHFTFPPVMDEGSKHSTTSPKITVGSSPLAMSRQACDAPWPGYLSTVFAVRFRIGLGLGTFEVLINGFNYSISLAGGLMLQNTNNDQGRSKIREESQHLKRLWYHRTLPENPFPPRLCWGFPTRGSHSPTSKGIWTSTLPHQLCQRVKSLSSYIHRVLQKKNFASTLWEAISFFVFCPFAKYGIPKMSFPKPPLM